MDVRFGVLHSELESDCDLLNYSAWPERFRAWMLKSGCICAGQRQIGGENVLLMGLGALLAIGEILYMARTAIWRGPLSGRESAPACS